VRGRKKKPQGRRWTASYQPQIYKGITYKNSTADNYAKRRPRRKS
jgi:hypothetical protein